MVMYLVIVIEVNEGFGDDGILHVGGLVEDDCGVDGVPALVVAFRTDGDVLLTVEVGVVWHVAHVCYDL